MSKLLNNLEISSISLDLICDAIMVRISFLSLLDSLYLFSTSMSIFWFIVALLCLSMSQGCYKIYDVFIRFLAGIKHLDIRFLAVALMFFGITAFFIVMFFIISQSYSPSNGA